MAGMCTLQRRKYGPGKRTWENVAEYRTFDEAKAALEERGLGEKRAYDWRIEGPARDLEGEK